MEIFFRAAAGVILALILSHTLAKINGEWAVLIGICVCSMILVLVCRYLQPIFDYMVSLAEICMLDTEILSVLLKVVGISLISQISSLVCVDGGSASMGKTLQLLSTALALYLSLPVLQKLLDLVRDILASV